MFRKIATSPRLPALTVEVAQSMKVAETELLDLRRAALSHDIGHFGIPEAILLKPGTLTPEERAIVGEHPNLDTHILQPLPHLAPALSIPRHHHERWDGSGYLDGLKEAQIPLPARIFAVVDVFDALISSRPYRPPWKQRKALNYMRQQAGIFFDLQAVQALLARVEKYPLTSRPA